MSLKNLVEDLPKIAKVRNWERFSKRNILMFNEEIKNKDSVFAHREQDKVNALERIAPAFIPSDYVGDKEAYNFGMDLFAYFGLCYREKKVTLTKDELKQKLDLHKSLTERSGSKDSIKQIESLVSIEEAQSGWWFGE